MKFLKDSFCQGLYIYLHLELKLLVLLIFAGGSAWFACLSPTCAAPVSRQNQLASSWWTAKQDFFFDLLEMKGEIILDFASFENRQTHVSFNVRNRRRLKCVGCRYAAPSGKEKSLQICGIEFANYFICVFCFLYTRSHICCNTTLF